MIPIFASFLCVLLILYLFRVDLKNASESVSKAVWIPIAWMFLGGSRFVSQWLMLGAPVEPLESVEFYTEGNVLDAAVFLALIIAGSVTVLRRNIDWNGLITQNAWVWLFFAFCAISMFWSDYPFVCFKRWVKAFGNVVMALVILTEQRPYEALGAVLRRLAYLLLPLSVLFIRYYPDLGRSYHMGQVMYTGVTFQKNSLGQVCLFSGIYFVWELVHNRRKDPEDGRKLPLHVYWIMLLMVAWLLRMANSATCVFCMFISICLFSIGLLPSIKERPGRIIALASVCVAVYGGLSLFFDPLDAIIRMLGRNSNLTERTPMWEQLLTMVGNPLVGVGYEMFWSGERMARIWATGAQILQAHNGYIDLYLNVGFVGLSLLLMSIVFGLIKTVRYLDREYAHALLRLSFIVVCILYNWTEATFKPVSNMFILLLIGILEVAREQHYYEAAFVPVDRYFSNSSEISR